MNKSSKHHVLNPDQCTRAGSSILEYLYLLKILNVNELEFEQLVNNCDFVWNSSMIVLFSCEDIE